MPSPISDNATLRCTRTRSHGSSLDASSLEHHYIWADSLNSFDNNVVLIEARTLYQHDTEIVIAVWRGSCE